MVDERKVLEGYKVTEVGVIPEDWEVFKLGDIIDYTKGFAFKSSDYRKSGVRIIRVSDTDYDQIKDADEIYIDKSLSHKFKKWKLTEDDIILSTVGSKPPMYDSMVGKAIKVSLRHEGALLNQNAVKIISKNNKLANQTLIFYNLKTKRYLTNIEKIFRGNANQASITLLDLFKFEIPMPKCDKEQKAIAEALCDTDNLISSLEKLIDKKKKIKQGAMQQLLTGKKRLPGFSGEWNEYKITDIAIVGRGRVISHREINNSIEKLYPVYSSQTSNEGIMGYIDSYDFEGDYITWTTDGVNAGKVFYRSGKFNCTNVCGTLKLIQFNHEFVSMALDNVTDKYVSKNLANPKLMNDVMKNIEIALPSIEEQKAIAQILSDMNAEIEALEEKLEKYKTIKQGMMQELLTGRIRLI